ncbi:MAG: FAD-dependent thymidylate synthase [Smithellaceae bacterium]|nr:FAD-dependent thymidylate synthase [Smithellaceae bacterium]NLX52805.1 FAD-dependent thymidylate synthase [Deltaproteobacteria bacterium]
MKILLAGCNIDYDLIRELSDRSALEQELTPETISAAYARISRSPKPVDELRRDARAEVEKARRSNRNIVFEMGHASVAEHAVFNIDVIGVSRLLVEEIEKFRLCSYTEKSQRYVLFDKDFVVPDEIRDAGLADVFCATVDRQNDFYHRLYEDLRPYVYEQNKDLAADPANKSLLEGWAKEDARYAIALATETQLGMTVNARNLELMLRRLAALPLAEARLYSEKLYAATKDIAPSLIRYTRATDYDRLTRRNLRTLCAPIAPAPIHRSSASVRLLEAAPDADTRSAAALIFAASGLTYDTCLARAKRLTAREARALFETVFAGMQPYDAALRELEAIDLLFELAPSASCFAQLKRHRMATLLCQDYDPDLGVTVPPSVKAVGRYRDFMAVIRETNRVYNLLCAKNPAAAAYVLTNAHRRRVLLKINAREMYHVARLRADAHAQWDIRRMSEKMLGLARRVMPRTLAMACGKDGFAARRQKAFARK